MHILCPSCSTENNIDIGQEVVCGKCKSSLSGFVYRKYKKPLVSAMTALLIGAYGSYKIEQVYLEITRYPVRIEYAIIDSCITSDRSLMLTSELKEKKHLCLCAYEKTMDEVSYNEYQNDGNGFFTVFRKNVEVCK